jgi:hypothetical protein
MALDLKDQRGLVLPLDLDGVVDLREIAGWKLAVDHSSQDLHHLADRVRHALPSSVSSYQLPVSSLQCADLELPATSLQPPASSKGPAFNWQLATGHW